MSPPTPPADAEPPDAQPPDIQPPDIQPADAQPADAQPAERDAGVAVEPLDAVAAESASAERTRLSWRRTTLAATVTVLLLMRLAFRDGWRPLAAVGAAAAMLGWLAQLRLTHRRIQAMAHHEPVTIGRTLPLTALLVFALGVVGVLLAVVHPPH